MQNDEFWNADTQWHHVITFEWSGALEWHLQQYAMTSIMYISLYGILTRVLFVNLHHVVLWSFI